MTKKDFDHEFKEKLSQLEPESNNSDWDAFSEMLKNEDEFKDLRFDQVVSDKIKEHRSEFNSSDWASLQRRLKKEEGVRRHLITSKACEILCIVMLLFLVDNLFFDHTEVIYSKEAYAIQPQTSTLTISHAEDSAQETPVSSTKINTTKSIQPIGLLESLKIKLDQISIKLSGKQPNFASNSSSDGHFEYKSDFETTNSNSIALAEQYSDQPANGFNNLALQGINSIDSKLNKDLPTLDMHQILLPLVQKSETKYNLMPTYAYGVGVIRSPFDEVYKSEAFTNFNFTTRTGAIFSIEKGNLEFITGAELERREYEPLLQDEIVGSLGNAVKFNLSEIELTTASIPIGMKINKNIGRNVNVYASANLGVNTILFARHRVDKEVIQNGGRLLNNSNKPNDSRSVAEPDLYKKDFTLGVVQGGNIMKNLYFTANAEIGLEGKINESQKWVAGVGFSRYIHPNGKGPNDDRLDFGYARVGLKYRL